MITLQYYKEQNDIDLIDTCYSEMLAEGLISDSDATLYRAKPTKMIWAYWRYTLMNTCGSDDSVARWKQRFKDTAYLLSEKYNILFNAYEELKGNGKLSEMYSTTLTTTHNEGTTHVGTSGEDTATIENVPQYGDASTDNWINNRNKNKSEGTTDGKTGDDGTIESQSALNLIPAEMAQKMRDSLFNPYMEYAAEFSKLFINFYADECGCGCGC